MAEGPCLTLYSRHHCHLCEDMTKSLTDLAGEYAFELAIVDIDSDPALAARFNELVPILMHGERELARYRLDLQAMRAYLAEIR